MLQYISIRNFVIIPSLQLEFPSGLSVFTGETGAGKSIIVDAIGLALGARVSGSVVGSHGDKAEISVMFDMSRVDESIAETVRGLLGPLDIALEGELIIRREIDAENRSKSFVNDRLVTLSFVKSFADLKGLKVGVGAPGSGTEANFRQLLDVYGMKREDVNAQYLSFAESAEQFKDNHIDAFIVVAGIPNSAIMDVGTVRNLKLLSIEPEKIDILDDKYPFLSPAKIPANTYKGQTEDVNTVAVNAVLIVNADIKEDVVYDLIKSLFENQEELASAHAKGKELNMAKASTGVSIPFHPGAVKFYKEKGLMK